ncbi:hypothetical protein NYP20_13980 [Pseudomonas sp. N3-W]|uniref:hypothetical protein n=1 Tax=Pseudomonas sp. N3-W TaxID=2975049 RepID=UPI00217E2C2B|nr:hypothetical protein [Pseudomonas sp. N3-W]UWF52007.1 hypothetical protein NYP20_13980 [Pseudomonas sp. N3-W]
MVRPIEEQIEVLLNGGSYAWAVSHGFIRQGEPMSWAKIFTITQPDVVAYLRSHPIPGIDTHVYRYQDMNDGPKWRLEDANYLIGWRERGVFSVEQVAYSEDELREFWIIFLARSLGLPA